MRGEYAAATMLAFQRVVVKCAANDELVSNFNRLTGCNLGRSLNRQPIEAMIDRACGVDGEIESDMRQFTAFVKDCVWDRLGPETIAALIAKVIEDVRAEGELHSK